MLVEMRGHPDLIVQRPKQQHGLALVCGIHAGAEFGPSVQHQVIRRFALVRPSDAAMDDIADNLNDARFTNGNREFEFALVPQR